MRTAEETRQLIVAYIRAFNARDLDAVAAIYAEDATLEDPVGSQVHEGKTAIRAFYEQYRDQPSFLQLTGDFHYAGDAVAFSFFCFIGTGKESMIVQITDTFRFDPEGKVKEMRAFWGEANVLAARSDRRGDGGQLPLAGLTALIAGDGAVASACARTLGKKGALIVVAGGPSQSVQTMDSVREAGGRAHALLVEPECGPGLLAVVELAADIHGPIYCCVNALELGSGDLGRTAARRAWDPLQASRPLDVLVNLVTPGWNGAIMETLRSEVGRSMRVHHIVSGEGAPLEAIADAVAYLVSPTTTLMNNQTLLIGNFGSISYPY